MVEFAFMSTILVSLVVGVLEIGSAWSDYQSLNQASRAGARVASQLGTTGEADSEALLAIEAAIGPLGDNLSRVVVYEADVNGDMPASCLTAPAGYTGSANCNVYDANSISNLATAGWWGSGTSCGTADANWCSASERNDDLTSSSFVGVMVEVDRPLLTGLFGTGTQRMTEATVMRIEPEIE